MKFVSRDPGVVSENSSGDGTDGILKELLYMLIAYWMMIAVMVLSGLLIVALAVWFVSA